MQKCEDCLRWEREYGRDVHCSQCIGFEEKDSFVPVIKEMVYLKGYGNVSKARLDALDSRVMLPQERTDGVSDYYVGTKLKNGKIIDKAIDIRP